MPFEIKEGKNVGIYRCETCGKLITLNPIIYKTCCMNKPAYFCSRVCFSRWLSIWVRNQEQVVGRNAKGKKALRRFSL